MASNSLFIGDRLPQECIDDLNKRIQEWLNQHDATSDRRISDSTSLSKVVISDLAQSRYFNCHTRDEYLYLEFTLEGCEWTIYSVSVPVVPYSGECTRSKTVWRDLPQGVCELLWDFAKERIPTLEQ